MDRLSPKFIDSCRVDNGRIMRGENMTRIETFVDAAFAFAFTMLVISIDEIPRSPLELLELSRDIPAFVMSASIIGSIWLAHSTWSRTFGLQDRLTINLSLGLVMLVLIFVYPIKLMTQATVLYISVNFFGTDLFDTGLFENEGWANNEVAMLFIYFALGLIALSLIIIAFNQNSLRYRHELRLNKIEIFYSKISTLTWVIVALTAVVSCIASTIYIYDVERIARAGLLYYSLLFTIPLGRYMFRRLYPASTHS